MATQPFELLNIETEVVHRRIKAITSGSPAEVVRPFLDPLINVLNSLKVIHEHPGGVKITVSGNLGDDAKPYQETDVARAIREAAE